MTLEEYAFRMRAYSFSRLQKLHDIHLQAWVNHAVKGTKRVGKREEPIYKKFSEFFDYDKEIKRITGEVSESGLTPQQQRMARIAKEFNASKE